MTNLKVARNAIKPYVLPIVTFIYRRLYMRLLCWWVGLRDKRYIQQTGFIHIPPASLRYRVHGTPYVESFLKVGKQCSQDIEAAVIKIGKDLNSFQQVLDFGCGCGRTLTGFADRPLPSHFYGTDIDQEAIAWCRNSLNFASFGVNQPLPPLGYSSEQFDLIYAISVFTHLNEDYQFRWLQELQRVIKSKGILLLTIHGYHCWKDLPREEVNQIEKSGFIFRVLNDWKGIFPDWYQTAYHTQGYILDRYARYFKIRDYIPRGLNNHQDLVILQKE